MIDNVNGAKCEVLVNLTKRYMRVFCTILANFCDFEIMLVYLIET